MEEEALFHFKNKFDTESYDRLQNFYISVIQKSNTIILLIFYVLSLIAFAYGTIFLNADIISYLIVEGMFTILVALVFIYPKLKKILNKKITHSKFYKKIREQSFTFFGDYFLIKEGNLEGKYKYSRVFRVYETNKDFFFRVNKNIAFILPKENILPNDEFGEFLERKFQQKFIKKYNKK